MTGYVLDTKVLSEVTKRRPNAQVLERLRAVPRDALFTSAVCVMELRFGASRHPAGAKLWGRIEREVLATVHVIPFGEAEARRAGELLAALERVGAPIGPEDVMIAATALEHGHAVSSRNVRHLARVSGLRVEDWWSPA